MNELTTGSVTLNYIDQLRRTAGGPAVIFHHGMGGDLAQPLGLLPDLRVSRLFAHDARGHGASSALTDVAQANFDVLADDVIDLADRLGLQSFVAAGISMGAGASLNLALRHPDRIAALILARPAWLDRPMEAWKQELFGAVAGLLEGRDPADAERALTVREDYRKLAAQYPATGVSLLGQLTRPQAKESTAVLRGFPRTAPSTDASAWAQIEIPTLVIAHGDDPFHAYEIGEEYARLIPRATLVAIPSKEHDPTGFAAGFQSAVQEFLDALSIRG